MKKILFLILVCGAMVFSASAQVTTTDSSTVTVHKYYYYPSTNVYFDEASGDYWYYDDANTRWNTVKTLPSTIVVEKTQKYPIDYKGNDPWKNNAADKQKYKVKDDKEKMKAK